MTGNDVDFEIKFLKGYTDGKYFLSEYDFIEIPDSEKERYRPITFFRKSKKCELNHKIFLK